MSCIKFPGSNREKSPTPTTSCKKEEDSLNVYNQLISYANEVFGSAKWSHSVTNQNLDFVEYAAGKFQVGCVSFIKVQLENGIFHEDMGYCSTDDPTKGVAVYKARNGANVNALKKVLSCFGGEICNKIKSMNQPIRNSTIPQRTSSPVPLRKTTVADNKPKQNGDISLPMDAEWSQEIVTAKPQDKMDIENKPPNLQENNATKAVEITASTAKLKAVSSVNNVTSALKTASSSVEREAMTEEELRQERKRRQKEKQEEYKRKYLEKCKQEAQQPNPRY